MSKVSYKRSLQAIHTEAVSIVKSKYSHNPLIQRPLPAVSASESSLPRIFQTTLLRLRSTYCSDLKSYKLKIRARNDDLCPSCPTTSQSVLHLFSCPAYPSTLTPLDLRVQSSGGCKLFSDSHFSPLSSAGSPRPPSTPSTASLKELFSTTGNYYTETLL
jgi:hypothetical protein